MSKKKEDKKNPKQAELVCEGCNMGYFGHWCCWHLEDGKCKALKEQTN
jgi:hypothetical protein